MAAAANQSSYTELNALDSLRAVLVWAQSPGIAVQNEVVKQYKIPRYDNTRVSPKHLHQPSKPYRHGYHVPGPVLASEQGPTARTGLDKTGKEKYNPGGHNSVDELRDRTGGYGLSLHEEDFTRFGEENYQPRRRIAYQEDLISNAPGDEPIPRLIRDLAAPEPPFFDHNGSPITGYVRRSHLRRDGNNGYFAGRHGLRSGWWPNGPGYQNNTSEPLPTMDPPTYQLHTEPDTEAEMLFSRPRRRFHGQLAAEVKSTYAGLLMVEIKTFSSDVRRRAIYRLANDRHSEEGHREWWSNSLRFGYDETANKGDSTGRLYNQIDTHFSPKQMVFWGPCGSASSAEIGGSNFTSHSVCKETIATKELDLLGRDRICQWKDGPGRNKNWRLCRYLKSMRKSERAKYQLSVLRHRSSLTYLNSSKTTNHHLPITHFPPHAAVPKDMLRQKPTSCQGHSSHLKPKSPWQAMNEMRLNKKTMFSSKSRARCGSWMTNPMDLLDMEEARTPKDRFSANSEVGNAPVDDLFIAMASTDSETSSPESVIPNAKSISLKHLLAYESFTDTILGACLRLKRLVRTESHYEVYDAESLSDGNQKYEVRAYNLRGLSPKARNYKIRNLKRASARSSCIRSLEQGGKKWLVFADARADLFPEPFRDCGPLWCTKEDYDRAFPVLEPRKPYNSQKTEKEALQDGVVVESYEASFAKTLEEELSKKLDANQALEMIDRLRERLVASFKSCHYDDKITPMSEKGKKPKSPEQAKRLRDRQRLSRQTKRMVKAALKTAANSDRGF